MTKYELKTKKNKASVTSFIQSLSDPKRKADANKLVALYAEATGEKAVMWGPNIIGFGTYHYIYASGQEGD